MSKTEELLSVLDLPEDEQWKWITHADRVCEFFPDTEIFIQDPNQYLADLAFRKKDEFQSAFQKVDFETARFHVFAHCNNKTYKWTEEHCNWVDTWFVEWAKPIHWIIAALIAKELSK